MSISNLLTSNKFNVFVHDLTIDGIFTSIPISFIPDLTNVTVLVNSSQKSGNLVDISLELTAVQFLAKGNSFTLGSIPSTDAHHTSITNLAITVPPSSAVIATLDTLGVLTINTLDDILMSAVLAIHFIYFIH